MSPTDQLHFLDGSGRRVYIGIWDGPWPPPERLSIMRGARTGYTVVVAEDAPGDVVRAARQLGTVTETRYRLRNASAIPEPAKEGEHWFRGAEYVPEGDDA